MVIFADQKYTVEQKKWYGDKAHQKGLLQLADYLDRQNLDKGFLIIYDSRRKSNKIGENQTLTIDSKKNFIVWV